MADERRGRPVSGEIMTDAPAEPFGRRLQPDGVDIVDADYEVVAAGVPRPQPGHRQADAAAPEGMDMLRPHGASPAASQAAARGGPLFWSAGMAVVLAAFWVAGGHALLRDMPSVLGPAEAGTAFSVTGVTSRVDSSGLKPVLFVDGEASNDGAGPGPLPPLAIHVTGNDGRVTLYRLGTSGRTLSPGERFAFSSRLEVPRNGVTAVSVGFTD